MKKIRITLIAALCMITAGLCILLAYGLAGGNLYRHTNHSNYPDVQKVLEKEISLDGIDSISVLYGMNHHDIYIYGSQSDTVLIKEYGYSETAEKELSTITENDNSLEIKGARWNHSNMEFGLFYFNNEYNCTFPLVDVTSAFFAVTEGKEISPLILEIETSCSETISISE